MSLFAQSGIDEALIERLVRGFYSRVREDVMLGPVFQARIADWEPHLQRMCAFWSSIALMSGRYEGFNLCACICRCRSTRGISTAG